MALRRKAHWKCINLNLNSKLIIIR